MDNEQVEQKAEMLARNEILGNQSMLVIWMLENDRDGRFIDELTNLYEPPQEAAEREGWNLYGEDDDEYFFTAPENHDGVDAAIPANDEAEAWESLCHDQGIEPEQKEVMEWYWIGWSGSFIEQDLQEVGAVLLYHPETDDVWWGRTQTGQSLAYDSDLKEVARRLIART